MAASSDTKKAKEPASHKFMVLFLGLLIGFVIGFVMLLSRLPVDDSLANYQARETIRSPAAGAQSTNYDFYNILPNQVEEQSTRIDVTESEPRVRITEKPQAVVINQAPQTIAPATRSVPANAQNLTDGLAVVPASYKKGTQQSFFLQAGNFGSHNEARSMQAQVMRLGLQAFVIEREEPGGSIRHRVRVGPFTEIDLLTEAKKRLKRGGINYEIIRVTG